MISRIFPYYPSSKAYQEMLDGDWRKFFQEYYGSILLSKVDHFDFRYMTKNFGLTRDSGIVTLQDINMKSKTLKDYLIINGCYRLHEVELSLEYMVRPNSSSVAKSFSYLNVNSANKISIIGNDGSLIFIDILKG